MTRRDPRIDAYIEKAPDYARPILRHLRAVVHAGCPQVEETLKWRMPSFEHEGLLCGMAAFKAHCTFGFWKHRLVVDSGGERWKEAMGSFGRITRKSDLPPKAELLRMVRAAVKLNEAGVRVPRNKRGHRAPASMPPALKAALARNKRARGHFESFSPSHRREYMEWIGEAKTEATREKRLEQALEWLGQGKHRHWKYEKRAK
jgi:hypothetical protein